MMRAGRTRAVLTALVVASTLAVTGCGSEGGSPAPADKADEPGKAAGDAEKPDAGSGKDSSGEDSSGEGGTNATAASLKFTSATIDGKTFKGEKRADKPAVLWFWAPWCGTCRGQAAQTAKLADKYEGKVNFVGVAGLDKTEPIKGFVSTEKVGNFTHLNDQKGSVWEKFGITQQSSYVMLDKNGKTVHKGAPSDPAELDKIVSGLSG